MQLGKQASPQAVPHMAAVNPYIHFSGQDFTTSPTYLQPSSLTVGPSVDRVKGILSTLDCSAQSMDQATLSRFLHGLSSTMVPSSPSPFTTSPPSLTSPLAYPLAPYPIIPPSSFQQPIVFLPPPPFQIASDFPSSEMYPTQPTSNAPPTYNLSAPPHRKTTTSGGLFPRYHPYPPKTQTGPIRGFSPAPSPPSSPARSFPAPGRKRSSFSEVGDLPSSPLKRRSSPPVHSPCSLKDRMTMATYSLTALQKSPPTITVLGPV
jgi:hypothetical protein